MNTFQKQWCVEIINKLLDMKITQIFKEDFSKILNANQNIFKSSITLETVMENLRKDKYKSIFDWCNDVNLIWYNAINYYKSGSPMFLIVETLQNWFKKHTTKFPSDKYDNWLIQFQMIKESAKKIIETMPKAK